MKLEITLEQINTIYAYLIKKPYDEVAGLIDMMKALKPIESPQAPKE